MKVGLTSFPQTFTSETAHLGLQIYGNTELGENKGEIQTIILHVQRSSVQHHWPMMRKHKSKNSPMPMPPMQPLSTGYLKNMRAEETQQSDPHVCRTHMYYKNKHP